MGTISRGFTNQSRLPVALDGPNGEVSQACALEAPTDNYDTRGKPRASLGE